MDRRLMSALACTSSLLLTVGRSGTAAPPVSAAPKTAAAPLLTEAEAKGVDGVVASMLNAGFPDSQKAGVYAGEVVVSATFDPAKEPHPLPSAASGMQRMDPNSSKVTY